MLFEKTTPICGSVYFVLGYLSYRKLELKSRSKSPHKLQLFLVLAQTFFSTGKPRTLTLPKSSKMNSSSFRKRQYGTVSLGLQPHCLGRKRTEWLSMRTIDLEMCKEWWVGHG